MAYKPRDFVVVVDQDIRCTQVLVSECRGGNGARHVGNRCIMMVDSIWDRGYDTHEIPQGHAFLNGKFLRLLANDPHRLHVKLIRQEPVSRDGWIYIDIANQKTRPNKARTIFQTYQTHAGMYTAPTETRRRPPGAESTSVETVG